MMGRQGEVEGGRYIYRFDTSLDSVIAEAIPSALAEMAFFARKTQNTVLACVVFWCSGILGWRPEKRGFGRRKAGDRLKEK
jgi:hypothetical protein